MDDQPRIAEQRLRDAKALLHSPREGPQRGLPDVVEICLVEDSLDRRTAMTATGDDVVRQTGQSEDGLRTSAPVGVPVAELALGVRPPALHLAVRQRARVARSERECVWSHVDTNHTRR